MLGVGTPRSGEFVIMFVAVVCIRVIMVSTGGAHRAAASTHGGDPDLPQFVAVVVCLVAGLHVSMVTETGCRGPALIAQGRLRLSAPPPAHPSDQLSFVEYRFTRHDSYSLSVTV